MYRVSETTRRAAAVLALAVCTTLASACMLSIGDSDSDTASREDLCVAEGKTYSSGAIYSFPAGARVCKAGAWESADAGG
jgi:hypothetical protein